MKTKSFLLATSGSTVDGRTIDDKMLKEMASSYDPKTYGARLNIEHIRGISGDGPFRAFGDVLELSTAEVEVNFNGKTEKRLGLYGVFDVTDDAKKLNEANQKVYPSIEIEPNFAGKGYAYMMGCALTDSPASIATQRLQFNRALPGTLTVTGDESALLEFAEEAAPEATGLLASIKAALDKFTGTAAPASQEPPVPPPPAAEPAAQMGDGAAFAAFGVMLTQMATTVDRFANESRAQIAALTTDLGQVKDTLEKTPAGQFHRAPATGGNANRTDC